MTKVSNGSFSRQEAFQYPVKHPTPSIPSPVNEPAWLALALCVLECNLRRLGLGGMMFREDEEWFSGLEAEPVSRSEPSE